MESLGNVKLKAKENWRKLSSAIMIWESRAIEDDSITIVSQAVIDVHDTAPSSYYDEHNQPKLIIGGLLLLSLAQMMYATTFPWISIDRDHPRLDTPIWGHLWELMILFLVLCNMLCYIYDLLIKDRKKRLVMRPYGVSWHIFGSLCGIHIFICSTVQYANFHLHEHDRLYKNCITFIFTYSLFYYRQTCFSTNELRVIKKASDLHFELSWLVIHMLVGFMSASWVCWEQLFFASNPRDPYRGMLLAILAVLYFIWGLIYKGMRKRVRLVRKWGIVWWFYLPDLDCTPFGTIIDIYGLISAVFQFIFCTVQYVCVHRNVDNPIRLCLLPSIFLICIACSTIQQNHPTKAWMFLLPNMGFEILSATYEQLSSPSKPHYALYGMLLAMLALIVSIWELVHKGKIEKVKWMRRGKFWWFYHPSPGYTPFGTFLDIYGLIGGIVQCSFSIVQYACYLRHVDNPIQLCPLPTIFYLCVTISRLIRKSKTH